MKGELGDRARHLYSAWASDRYFDGCDARSLEPSFLTWYERIRGREGGCEAFARGMEHVRSFHMAMDAFYKFPLMSLHYLEDRGNEIYGLHVSGRQVMEWAERYMAMDLAVHKRKRRTSRLARGSRSSSSEEG